MVNFYRKSLPKAAEVLRHLVAMIKDIKKKDKRPAEWTEDAERAFKTIKKN